jgi:predicted acyl esterase
MAPHDIGKASHDPCSPGRNWPELFVSLGYVVVYQDCRGRCGSEYEDCGG